LGLAYLDDGAASEPLRRTEVPLGGASIAALVGAMLTRDVGSSPVPGLAVVALASVPRASWRTRDGNHQLRAVPIPPADHASGRRNWLQGEAVPFLAMVLLSFGVGWLSWRYAERPFIPLKSRIATSTGRSEPEAAALQTAPTPVAADRRYG
jgi:hypothetical protein